VDIDSRLHVSQETGHTKVTAEFEGTATAGDYGTATAGHKGIATAGDFGIATAGHKGIATAGDRGIIQIRYYDGNKYRVKVGYIGENGLEAGVPYILKEGEFVRKVSLCEEGSTQV
jgi:hypothetical protein